MKRCLVITAHPDDIEFGCSGSIAVMRDEGWDVRYVIVTSGQRGTQDPTITVEEMGAIREKEAIEAAAAVGVDDVVFLGYVDGDLIGADPIQLRKDLAREFRAFKPHRLITMSVALVEGDVYVNHPDHKVVAEAALDITVSGGSTASYYPDLGLPAWRELGEIWIFAAGGGKHAVDVTAAIDRKIASLLAHTSQMGEWPDGSVGVAAAVREWLHRTGEPHGYEYAEAFRVIKIRR